ncbi:necrosis inducing-like protein NPP1 type [Phytophthora sojae]|uniref:Necrosis inducing-like protein NPP1 type n=1 Tax=Phytophthora sojae (strain P6497) TaxID=1094619 RepID=G4Z8A9_PHYSP|nr:necrosis inducing-like protein NPP1 type [Phytophthora sojae]EGZ21082.1 necrosis inducing-like protein NPP1 type [Phytophthora sojae]|eukprot:XP_009523799.1 necrosis inducing-like protein NPP1 type [Phytophthora sojae]
MNLRFFFVTLVAVFTAVADAGSINHDQVRPFAQPKPATVSEKAAVKFNPQIHITNGCHPYPAVNAAGETSGGLQTNGAPSAGCKGSGWGSQVYGRSTWYKGRWAIMYSWYFPKDSPSTTLGHRHDWEHVVVWIDNPAVANPKILAVTPSAHSGYSKYAPPKAGTVTGNTAKVNYESHWPVNHALDSTDVGGDAQDLIMWEQQHGKLRRRQCTHERWKLHDESRKGFPVVDEGRTRN